jgi:hypothetical protein
MVLRHQLDVLRRKTGRPGFTMLDRIVLAARKPHAPPRPLGIIPRHAADAAALAPHARPIQVDLLGGPQAGPTADRP